MPKYIVGKYIYQKLLRINENALNPGSEGRATRTAPPTGSKRIKKNAGIVL